MKIILTLYVAFFSLQIFAGSSCGGCTPCSCGGSSGTYCSTSGAIVKATGIIDKIPFTKSESVDRGCYGTSHYSINLTSLPQTITIFSTIQVIDKLPMSSISGSVTRGSCVSCGGCHPCPSPTP